MRSRAIVTLLVLMGSQSLQAQTSDEADPLRSFATREELQSLLGVLDRTLESPVYGEELKQLAQDDAAVLRNRLTRGDFEVGDKVLLVIESAPTPNDTLVVNSERAVVITGIGTVGLNGVLRSELEEHLLVYLSRFLRDPIIRASSLIRLSIAGSVGRPGFYTIPSNRLLSDVIMGAGGPSGGAELDDTRIERNSQTFIASDEVRVAIRDGRTLDQLGVRAGDRLVVPGNSGRGDSGTDFANRVRGYIYILTLPATVIGLTRLF